MKPKNDVPSSPDICKSNRNNLISQAPLWNGVSRGLELTENYQNYYQFRIDQSLLSKCCNLANKCSLKFDSITLMTGCTKLSVVFIPIQGKITIIVLGKMLNFYVLPWLSSSVSFV